MIDAAIVALRSSDLLQLRALLAENDLPNDDCAEQLQNIVGIFNAAELIAAGGLEPVAPYALLRSIVVRQGYRAQGLAKRITNHLLQQAQAQGVAAVYLLTETAQAYFEGMGFRAVERAEVPQSVQGTRQFESLCPQTASCMRIDLPLASAANIRRK
jgi:amino-acid N-acetyltransferase